MQTYILFNNICNIWSKKFLFLYFRKKMYGKMTVLLLRCYIRVYLIELFMFIIDFSSRDNNRKPP